MPVKADLRQRPVHVLWTAIDKGFFQRVVAARMGDAGTRDQDKGSLERQTVRALRNNLDKHGASHRFP